MMSLKDKTVYFDLFITNNLCNINKRDEHGIQSHGI